MDIQRGKNRQLMGKSGYSILNFQINYPRKFKKGKNGNIQQRGFMNISVLAPFNYPWKFKKGISGYL